jgi:TonB family protein
MPVLDSGRTSLSGQHLLFVVTEYAEENLAQVIPQRALTPAEADAMLRPTVAALAYLHRLGLIHGHVRPANAMAVGDQLKLSSDGIRPAGAGPRKAQSSAYDAPEIQSGQGSSATDIWSLGAMLVESLTQHIPGSKVDVATLPQPFAEIVRHCLVSNPSGRWTADEIAAAIHLKLDSPRTELRTDKKQPAKAPEAAVVIPSESRFSRPAAVAAMLVVFAVLAILFAWRLLHHASAPSPENQAATSESAPLAPARPAPAPVQEQRSSASESAGVVHRVLPNPSRGALSTIQGRVKVRMRLKVDEAGNVTDARFISAGPSKYFSRLAMEAAKQWKFAPTSASEWNLLFEFTRGGVEALPQRVKNSH